MAYKNSVGKSGYVYILSNYNKNVLYSGVTSSLDERIIDHKYGKGSKFSAKYNLTVLLYFEEYLNINEAIEREKQLKNWHREWKFNLIRESNPELKELFEN
jgi:putative endonuclease